MIVRSMIFKHGRQWRQPRLAQAEPAGVEPNVIAKLEKYNAW